MHRFLFFSIFIFGGLFCTQCNTQPGAPEGLICELLRAPEKAVITDPQPEFGWIVNDSRRGAAQSAWQILVATSRELLNSEKGDMWDSGKIMSDQSINLEYQGRNLQPNKSYYWKVRTWDGENIASPYSAIQEFHTGRLVGMLPESKWIQRGKTEWVLENRQRADYHEIDPKELSQLGKGHYIADFGKAAFGTLQLTISSQKNNDSLTIYLGERKTSENRVDRNLGRSKIALYSSSLQLKKGTHTYSLTITRKISHYPNSQILAEHMPEVTPFRYAEIVNSPSEIQVGDIKQIALILLF